MKEGKVYIGTSGWSYENWRDIFYPPSLKPTEWLEFYSKTFKITELNMSFYRLPTKQTIEGWVKKVPSRFKFCLKLSRYITHIKRLKEPEKTVNKFFDRFKPMQKKLGPVLIQLPPSLKFDPDTAEHFFLVLKQDYKAYQFALEVRHKSWLKDESFSLMSKYNIAFVISQSAKKFPYAEVVTDKKIYVRFHGPRQLYASGYKDRELKKFADLFKAWRKQGHTIWAFFNNDVYGHAIEDALRLEKMLQ
jgi:uncharacterized protein YecE (DUF72 family)